MQNFMYSFKGGSKITIDPNDVVINSAGTNMTIATYPTNRLNVGDKRPVYEPFRELQLGPGNKKKLEVLFKEKQAEHKKKIKQTKTAARKERLNKKAAITA